MIIQSGTVSMESERQFSKKHVISQSITSGASDTEKKGEVVCFPDRQKTGISENGVIKGSFLSALAYNKYGRFTDEADSVGNRAMVRRDQASELDRTGAISKEQEANFDDINNRVQFSALNYLFRIFFGDSNRMNLQSALWGSAATGGYDTYQFTETYEESEVTNFETTGTVQTADGRQISFNLSVGMSRSFYSETNASILMERRPMIDPLVINLDDNVDSVSDQTFFFDLDCDGNLDEISSLNRGSGFLALDKNGDGEVNDGSELFGALSGDGFAELAQYDMDGNGWIDEADDIYDKLRVWSVDKDGNPKLFTLKESDVGAICLASAPTQFSINNEWNQTRAMVRSSGFFLRESTGMAGSVQQIDLAAM